MSRKPTSKATSGPASKPASNPRSPRSANPAKSSWSKPKQAKAVSLIDIRDAITSLDEQLVQLLNARASLVVQVGSLKRAQGLPTYAPHREAQVLDRVLGLSKGPLPQRTLEAMYRELMSGSFTLQQPVRVGFLGPEGSYSHLATIKHFGSSVAMENLHDITSVFSEVARQHIDFGMAPIENTIGGGIVETLDAFRDMVLHEGKRLTMWADWCTQAGIHYTRVGDGIEFSTLEQAIHAARKGVGLAIVDLNMIEEEIGDGTLVRLSSEQVVGPFGYWLDVASNHVATEHVRVFAAWLREQVAERT
jgi:chorismate mutase